MKHTDIVKKLSLKYSDFISEEEESLKNRLENILLDQLDDEKDYDYSREEFLNDYDISRIDDYYWHNVIGYILDEKRGELFIFMSSFDVDYEDPSFANFFIDIFSDLDSVSSWNVSFIEIDEDFNENQRNIIGWYMSSLVDSSNLSEKDKDDRKTKIRELYSDKFSNKFLH